MLYGVPPPSVQTSGGGTRHYEVWEAQAGFLRPCSESAAACTRRCYGWLPLVALQCYTTSLHHLVRRSATGPGATRFGKYKRGSCDPARITSVQAYRWGSCDPAQTTSVRATILYAGKTTSCRARQSMRCRRGQAQKTPVGSSRSDGLLTSRCRCPCCLPSAC